MSRSVRAAVAGPGDGLPKPPPPTTAPATSASFSEAFLQTQRAARDSGREVYLSEKRGESLPLKAMLQLSVEQGLLSLRAPTVTLADLTYPIDEREGQYLTITVEPPIEAVIVDGIDQPTRPPTSIVWIDGTTTDDNALWQVSLTTRGNFLSLNGQSVLGRVSLMQALVGGPNGPEPRLSVTVTAWQPGPRLGPVYRATGKDLDDLRNKNPQAFRRYIEVMLDKVAEPGWLRPGAGDVYGAFTDIPADPAARDKVSALLPEFDSPDPDHREKVASRLMSLGDAGVLAALRTDEDSLNAEQRARLSEVVARHRRRSFDPMTDALKDRSFLLDCLEHPDPRVRGRAATALEELLGTRLNLSAESSLIECTDAADKLRLCLGTKAETGDRAK